MAVETFSIQFINVFQRMVLSITGVLFTDYIILCCTYIVYVGAGSQSILPLFFLYTKAKTSICSLLSITFAIVWILLGLSNQGNAGSNIASSSHAPYNSVIVYHY